MQLPIYIGLAKIAEEHLARSFETIGKKHASEIDVLQNCKKLARWSKDHVENLILQTEKYGKKEIDQAKDISSALFNTKMSPMGLLRDLHGLWLLTCEVEMCYIILSQGARAVRDRELELLCEEYCEHTGRQKMWLQTKIKSSASQILVVAEE